MQANVQYILIGLIAIVALITLVVTLRVRHHKRNHPIPDLGEVEDILFKKNESNAELIEPQLRNSDKHSMQSTRQSPKQESTLSELGFGSMDNVFASDVTDEHEPMKSAQKQIAHNNMDAINSDLIVIYVMAAEEQQFIGYDLLQALLAAGLRFGDMSIFHRYQDAQSGGKIIFSLASATEPGIFDMNKMGGFSCKGLTLFLQLRGAYHNTAALELFLMTAEQLAEDLEGVLRDEHFNPLTPDMVVRYHAQVKRHLARLKSPELQYSHR